MSARTTLISVAYNSAEVVPAMLASVPPTNPIVVVDNASTDQISEVVGQHPNASLQRQEVNEGFGRACNAGAAGVASEFLLFINPDACLLPGALEALETAADQRPDFGAANPLILNAKGQGRLKMTSPLPIPKMPRPALDQIGQLPVLSGGVLFVRRAAFEKVSGFDPAIFLYHEDHDLSLRLREAGFSLWHVPTAQAKHVAGTGSPRTAQVARWKGYQMARSRYYVLEKAEPGSGFRRTFWPALLGLVAPTNFLSKRRRAKYLGQIKGAFSARTDGGRF